MSQPASSISPIVPLVGSAIVLLVIGTAAVFLPVYLIGLQTYQGESIIFN